MCKNGGYMHCPNCGTSVAKEDQKYCRSCGFGLERIAQAIESGKPRVAVVDSIQTLYSEQLTSAPGSVAQVRECVAQLTRQANPADGLRVFCSYVGWYNTDTNKPRCKPFADQLERLRQLAALPNLCNKLK